MNEKCFELLKELLLQREAGAYETTDKALSLTIDIYCEQMNIEREEFIKQLSAIYHMAWDRCRYADDLANWKMRIKTYERLINTLQ